MYKFASPLIIIGLLLPVPVVAEPALIPGRYTLSEIELLVSRSDAATNAKLHFFSTGRHRAREAELYGGVLKPVLARGGVSNKKRVEAAE